MSLKIMSRKPLGRRVHGVSRSGGSGRGSVMSSQVAVVMPALAKVVSLMLSEAIMSAAAAILSKRVAGRGTHDVPTEAATSAAVMSAIA